MRRDFDEKFGVYKGIDTFFTDNADTVTLINIPILTTYKGNLVTKIDAIRTISERTAINTKGITLTKAEAEDAVVQFACTVAAMLFAYADDNTNTQLKRDMQKVTPSNLKARKDEEVLDSLYNILNKAQEISTVTPPATNPLLPYGFKADVIVGGEITEPGTLTQLETAIQTYSQLTTSPRTAIAGRKTSNQQLKKEFKETDALLRKMDKVINGVKATYPEFYDGWYNMRELIGPMRLSTRIAGVVSKVTNIELGTTAIVEGAKVTVIGLPYTTIKSGQTVEVVPEPVIVKTNEEGEFTAPKLDFRTTYVVKCSDVARYGEQEKTEVRVKRGKKTMVTFLLEPVV